MATVIPPRRRKQVYDRDGHRCRYCGVQFDPLDRLLTVDHVIPLSRDGSNGVVNLVTCCQPCNQAKGDRTPEEAEMEIIVIDAHFPPYGEYRHRHHPKSPFPPLEAAR